jgi:hypothetical protein
MGAEKWIYLLERGDRKIFQVKKLLWKNFGYTMVFRGEVFETVEGRRTKTPPDLDFKTQNEAFSWAVADRN